MRSFQAQGTDNPRAEDIPANAENAGTTIDHVVGDAEDTVLSLNMPGVYTPLKDQRVKAAAWLKGFKDPQSEYGRCTRYMVEQATGERTLGYLAGVAVESETDAQQLGRLKSALDTYQKNTASLPPAMQMFADQSGHLSPAQFLEFVRLATGSHPALVTGSHSDPYSRRPAEMSN